MDRNDPEAAASTADLPSTPRSADTDPISEVDSRSPILPQHTATDATRNTSYASIAIPEDGADSPSPPATPVPTARPKWTRPIISAASTAWRFLQGPTPPVKTYIKPFFPRWQSAPSRLLIRAIPKSRRRRALQVAFWALWLTIFAVITHWSRFRTSVGGIHANADGGGVRQLTCTSALWWRNNDCGMNGDGCKPFENTVAMPFRCPSGCISSAQLLNPRQVGNRSLVFETLVVGGPGQELSEREVAYDAPYRADSFICSAAIHAGVVSNTFGGCGLLLQTGASSYPPGLTGSKRHGIKSTPFDSSFPSTFAFVRPPAGTKVEGCLDLRWHLLPITSFFTFLQAIFSTQAATLFGTVFVGIFWHVGLASDPPPPQVNRNDQFEVVSLVVGRFLPAAFIMYIFYLHVLGPTWATNTSPHWPTGAHKPQPPFRLPTAITIERAILLLFGWWFGALNNVTFAKVIPLARLTPHDLATQPGAKTALSVVIIVLIAIAVGQIYFFRREGRLPRFLALYLSFGMGLVLFTFALKDLAVRIHHYILAILLLPGTKLGTRMSILYQGLLLGLFVNGAARWGFASLLETKGVLLGDAVYGSGRIPTILPPVGGNVVWEYDAGEPWKGSWALGEEWNVNVTSGRGLGEGEVWLQNVTLRWAWPTQQENRLFDGKTGLPIEGAREWDGVSLLLNDVERYRGGIPEAEAEPTQGAKTQTQTEPGSNSTIGRFTWTRRALPRALWGGGEATPRWERMYVRMAYTTSRNSRGVGDYTRAGTVGGGWPAGGEGDGGWLAPEGGRT